MPAFKQIWDLPNNFQEPAQGIAHMLTEAALETKTDGGSTYDCMDLKKANKAIKDSHDNLAVVGLYHRQNQQSHSEVKAQFNWVKTQLNSMGVEGILAGGVEWENAIEQGFTNLATQKDDAWVIWQDDSAHKTTYQYNLLFAVQKGNFLLAVPVSMTVTANKEKKKFIGITVSDTATFMVTLDVMKITEYVGA